MKGNSDQRLQTSYHIERHVAFHIYFFFITVFILFRVEMQKRLFCVEDLAISTTQRASLYQSRL